MVLETKEKIVEYPYPILKIVHTHDGVALTGCHVPHYMSENYVNNTAMKRSIIIPAIEKVSVYPDKDGKDKTVVIKFSDGTTERASTRHGDEFDLETGISLCIAKKMYATLARTPNGKSSGFSKIVHKAVKIYKNGIKEEEARKKRAAEEKLAEQRRIEKRKKRAEKRRQRKVNLLKDAFVAAFDETKKEG